MESLVRKRIQDLKPVRIRVEEEHREKEEEEEPMSPWACAFHNVAGGIYIIAILGVNERLNPTFVKDNLLPDLIRNPRFSSLQVFDEKDGKMKWVKTNVNVEDHVIVPQLNNQDMDLLSLPHNFIEDYISNLSKTSLDISKPLWDFHILNLKADEAEAICIFRVHHSLGDGFSLISQLLASTRKVSDPMSVPSIPMKKKKKKKSHNHHNYYINLWRFFHFFWNSMVDIIMFIAKILLIKDSKTPISNVTGSVSSCKRFVFKILSLDDIKLVKNATHSTVNDVIMAILQASLSRYLNRLYGDNNRTTEKENNLPKRLRINALVPVAFDLEINALTETMEQKSKNNIGHVFFPLKIAIKDDPLDYIHSVKAAMDRKKNSLEAIASAIIFKLFMQIFGVKGVSFVARRLASQSSMLFSNVPGPAEQIAWYGHQISYIAPTLYGTPNALTIHVQSYCNKLALVLSVDEATVPDPHQLSTDFEDSLNLIKNAAISNPNMMKT